MDHSSRRIAFAHACPLLFFFARNSSECTRTLHETIKHSVTTAHLSLLEDASNAILEGHRLFVSQYAAAPEKRDLVAIARALRATHLGVEKVLKHAIAQVEPHLLLEKAETTLIRSIAKDLRELGAPTFLATRVPVRTLRLEAAWEVVLDVLAPPIPDHRRDNFAATLKDLARKRNQAQHGELFGDPSDYLLTLEQLFSQLRPVLEILVPASLTRLHELNDTIVASLRGIEARVDAGWILLQDSIAAAGDLKIAFKIYVTLPGADRNLEVVFTMDRDEDTASLSILTLASIGESSGLFLRLLTPEQQRSRREAQVLDLPIDQIPEPPAPPDEKPCLGLLSIPEDPISKAMRIASHKKSERQRLAIEQFGLTPLEDGELLLPPTSAWISWVRTDEPGKKASATITLRDCGISFQRNNREGRCGASVMPNPDYAGAAEANPLVLDAAVRLTGEYVVDESGASDRLPIGAVFRVLRANGTIAPQPRTST